jgi:NTP pyrophosphatase (non-canonical NTP hydrolase)
MPMSTRAEVSSLGLFGLKAEPAARSAVADIASIRPRTTIEARAPIGAAVSPKQRTRIWDLHSSLHCSIIGTCLTTGELRRLLVRLKVAGAETADDHDLHMLGVLLAARPQAGAKHLQKTIERRHHGALHQFAKAKNAEAVRALWQDALQRGDIPGAYWALLTHPATTDAMVKQAFGEVHMLSHLVGAANRADIQRLRRLEVDNASLAAKLERQQRQLHDGFKARDETIRRLTDALARKAGDDVAASGAADDAAALTAALAERDRRLTQEQARRQKLEHRIAAVAGEHDEVKRALELGERDRETLRSELALIERQIGTLLRQDDDQSVGALDLRGLTVLYVGGRAHQTPLLKGLIARANGRFLHHDGGLEHNAALLPGLVSRADLAVFPVDCVSHDAVASLKRVCGQMGKRYLPLRTSSLTCLLSGLVATQLEPATSPDTAPV